MGVGPPLGPLPHGTLLATAAIGEDGPILKLKLQMTSSGVVGGPALEAGARQVDGHVHTVEVELGRSGEDAHCADDGEADRHQRQDDRQPGGDPSQIQRQSGTAGHHQMAEHPVGEVGGTRRGAEGGGHDEAEDVQHARDKRGVDGIAAGRPVGLGRKGMEQ